MQSSRRGRPKKTESKFHHRANSAPSPPLATLAKDTENPKIRKTLTHRR
jgi:hypothetical protein